MWIFTETIDYLVDMIPTRQVGLASPTTDAIHALQEPTYLTEIRFFIGLWNVFWRFVSDFAKLVASLKKNLLIDQPTTFYSLHHEETRSMNALKQTLRSPPALALPSSHGQIILDRDACTLEDGCVLIQKQFDGKIKPIVYWWRPLQTQNANTTQHSENN